MARANPFDSKNGRTWFHRGFMCYLKQRERRIRCQYKLTGCNLWIPREFFWENTSKADCCHYIDLLAAKRLNEAREFDERKLAIEHVYDKGTGDDRPFVNVSAQRLIAMMRGEEVLEVPLDARIRFSLPGGKYTANDIDAAILGPELMEEYVKSIRRMVGEGVPIFCVKTPAEKELMEKYGARLTDSVMHSGFNLAIARGGNMGEVSDVGPSAPAPAPVQETEVRENDHGTHTETVSLITGNDQVPYFVRRLIRGQHLLWCGTSYDAAGPWSEHQRDEARLSALGIVIR